MTQTQMASAVPPVVYLDERRNLDKTIDLARFGARKDHVTVIIQRTLTTRKGDPRRVPILQITPQGDIREIAVPTLRTPISASLADADFRYRTGQMNARQRAGHAAFTELVKLARDYVAAKAEHEQNRKQRRQHKQDARRNANTTTMLSEQAARKHAA